MRWFLSLYLGALLALAGVAWATDGDPARAGGDANPSCYNDGQYNVCEYLLCDGYAADPNDSTHTCSDFDLVDDGIGMPVYAVVHLIEVDPNNCTGTPAVMVTGTDSTSGSTSDLLSAGLTDAGTSQSVIQPVPNRILAAGITSGDDCTDIEVILKVFVERDQP